MVPPSLLPLCPPSASSGTGEYSRGSGSAPSLFPVGQRNPSNLGESDEAVSVSQLSAVHWGTHMWSWVPAVPRSPNGYSITDFPRFSAFLRWLCLFFSICYNLGLLMDKDVAVSHHQNFLCRFLWQRQCSQTFETRSIQLPCWSEPGALSSVSSTMSKN